MPELHTDEALLNALRNASYPTPSQEQMERQRLSFVMGVLPEENHMTREQVLDVLALHGEIVPAFFRGLLG